MNSILKHLIRAGLFIFLLTLQQISMIAQSPYFQDCPDDLVFCDYSDTCATIVDWDQPIALDGLGDTLEVVQILGPLPGNLLLVGAIENIQYTATDNQGNEIYCEFTINIEDCMPPIPYCYNGLATVVIPAAGIVDVWARDFDVGSCDNCCDSADLVFRIIRSVDNPNNILPAEDNNPATAYPTGMTFTCDDVADVSTVVQIWVGDCGIDRNMNGVIEDEERNWDFCETYVLMQDPNDVCPDTSGIILFGEVITEEGHGIDSVAVTMTIYNDQSGLPPIIVETTYTDEEGLYHLSMSGLPIGQDADISFSIRKDGDDLNGVNVLDLILIQKHILSLQTFDNYYKYIAADANHDNNISVLDIIELRKLILGIFDELPNSDSWRFVDTDYDFSDGIWNYQDNYSIQFGESNDFIGVKIGDVH